MKHLRIILLFVALIAVTCKNNPFRVDVSDIKTNLNITRFEKELFSTDPSALENYIPKWKNEYGEFFQHYSYILKLGYIDDPGFVDGLRLFVTDHTNYQIYKRTLQVFPDLGTFTAELNDAFSHYRYYFPNKPIPRVVTSISGFNQSAITDDSLLAMGLDKYLGTGENLYKQYGIYNNLV